LNHGARSELLVSWEGGRYRSGGHSGRTHYGALTEIAPIARSAGHDSAVLPRFEVSYQADEPELVYLTAANGYGSGTNGAQALHVSTPDCRHPRARPRGRNAEKLGAVKESA
jgi:hypothetical protein